MAAITEGKRKWRDIMSSRHCLIDFDWRTLRRAPAADNRNRRAGELRPRTLPLDAMAKIRVAA
jgi:hypothetical protein